MSIPSPTYEMFVEQAREKSTDYLRGYIANYEESGDPLIKFITRKLLGIEPGYITAKRQVLEERAKEKIA